MLLGQVISMARAPIDGSTLKWARESINMEREELARAINVSAERIAELEEGEQPTFKQLLKLANKLDRSAAFFFAKPPEEHDVPETVDFRGKSDPEISSVLAKELRRVNQYRASFLELTSEWYTTKQLERVTWDNVEKRASEFRQHLGLTEFFAPPTREPQKVFNFWREALEQAGYLIFQTTRINIKEFRGFSINHAKLPIIVVNGSDAPNGKAFTLFHEVCHIANRTSGLCILNERINEEALANSFAANFLMPRPQVQQLEKRIREHTNDHIAMSDLVAQECRVSTLAAGIRLRTLNYLNESQLKEIWEESDEKWKRNRDRLKSRPGGPPPWRTRMRDLGPAYVGTVAEAVDDGRVSLLDATYLMNARLPTVSAMIEDYRHNEGRE